MFQNNMWNWTPLNQKEQIEDIKKKSELKTQIIFKHSTRCSISSSALGRMERANFNDFSGADFYYLDLIQYRDISNSIASEFSVHHESPQVLIIKKGECIADYSHFEIRPDTILADIS